MSRCPRLSLAVLSWIHISLSNFGLIIDFLYLIRLNPRNSPAVTVVVSPNSAQMTSPTIILPDYWRDGQLTIYFGLMSSRVALPHRLIHCSPFTRRSSLQLAGLNSNLLTRVLTSQANTTQIVPSQSSRAQDLLMPPQRRSVVRHPRRPPSVSWVLS